MANATLLEETLDHLLLHPEEHDQNVWIEHTECGTTRCFAGTALMLTGYTFWHDWCFVPDNDALGFGWDGKWDGKRVAHIRDVAKRELDLDYWQAEYLFHESRTIGELEQAVKVFADAPAEIVTRTAEQLQPV